MAQPSEEQVHYFMAEVAALHRALLDVGEAVAATAGVTYTRLCCLREIADAQRTVATVAARLGVARQGVQRTADGLVADGLAAWADNPRHRRAKLLTPTAAGRRVLRVAAESHASWVARAGARLPDDLVTLAGRIRAIRDGVAEPDEASYRGA